MREMLAVVLLLSFFASSMLTSAYADAVAERCQMTARSNTALGEVIAVLAWPALLPIALATDCRNAH